MFRASSTTAELRVTSVLALFFIIVLTGLLASCASSDSIGGQRALDPSLPTAVPDTTDAPGSADGAPSDPGEQAEVEVAPLPTPVPTPSPIVCQGGDPGSPFTVPLVLTPGASLDLIVEVRDQSGTEGQPDLVRTWPVTVTVSDRIDEEWLMIWEATRSALDLPLGFSTSDANELQSRGLPPMPPAFYRISADGTFTVMEIPAGFGRGVAQVVRDAAAAETVEPVRASLETLADLYAEAPPDVFEVAMTEARIFHEFATSTFAAEPVTAAGEARASSFLLEPITTAVTTQLDASFAERGCAAVTKRWTITPEERNQDARRPGLEAVYVGRFDSVSGQPAEIVQTVTLVGEDSRRDFTTTLTVTRPWS